MSKIEAVFFPLSKEEFYQIGLTILNNGELNIISNDAGKFMMQCVVNKADAMF